MITPKDAVTQRYRQEQRAISLQTVNALRVVWDRNMEPGRFADAWVKLYPLLRDMILYNYRASAASGAAYYRRLYAVEGRGLPVVLSATPDIGRLDHVSDSVTNGTFFHQLNKQQRDADSSSLIARNSFSGAGARFALSGGRDTVIGTTYIDTSAQGWERLISPEACSFCTSHAVRGPFKPGMNDFHPHDYCSCVAVPLFRGEQPINIGLAEEWKMVTQGKTGKEARAAWEQARADWGKARNAWQETRQAWLEARARFQERYGQDGQDTNTGDSRRQTQGEGTGSSAP